MRKFIRTVAFIFSLCFILLSLGFTPKATISSYDFGNTRTTQEVKVTKVTFSKHEYSKWKRLNEVFTARRAGETSHYAETNKISFSSSLEVSVPLKYISASIGFTIEKSATTTIRGTNSAGLKAKESAAFYYREHYKVYKVEEEITTTTYSSNPRYYSPPTVTVTKTCRTETIKIAQKLDSSDYGWFYSMNSNALTKTLDGKYCDDDYSCKVK